MGNLELFDLVCVNHLFFAQMKLKMRRKKTVSGAEMKILKIG